MSILGAGLSIIELALGRLPRVRLLPTAPLLRKLLQSIWLNILKIRPDPSIGADIVSNPSFGNSGRGGKAGCMTGCDTRRKRAGGNENVWRLSSSVQMNRNKVEIYEV
jgi:hypothetical protein